MPAYQPENEIYIHEGAGGVKRGQTEPEKNSHHDKWRKPEGIKRGWRDIPRVPYEEYEASWDQEIQAKKCRGSINCLLDRCGCMERLAENMAGTVQISPPDTYMGDQQAGMITALSAQPGRASTAAVHINLASPATVSQQGTQGGGTDHGVDLCIVWGKCYYSCSSPSQLQRVLRIGENHLIRCIYPPANSNQRCPAT
jgi:hypothetical protein